MKPYSFLPVYSPLSFEKANQLVLSGGVARSTVEASTLHLALGSALSTRISLLSIYDGKLVSYCFLNGAAV